MNGKHMSMAEAKIRSLSHVAMIGLIICQVAEVTPSIAGELYTAAGNALGIEINRELIRRNFCVDAAECHRLIQIYAGHGNQVNFTVYGLSDKNREALIAITDLIVRRGITITRGTPIKLVAYSESHDETVNLGFFKSKTPILNLEVTR